MWMEAYKWAERQLKMYISRYTSEPKLCYRVPDDALICEPHKDIWETFDEYKIQHFTTWDVKLPEEKADWLNGVCKCPTYLRDFVCKHLLELAIFLRHVEPPLDVKNMFEKPLKEQAS